MHTLICLTLLACHAPLKQSLPLALAGQFDAATTFHVLNACPQCSEANPVLRPLAKTPAIFPVLQMGDYGALELAVHYGRRRRWVRWSIIAGFAALHVYAGIHNLKVTGAVPPPAGTPAMRIERIAPR